MKKKIRKIISLILNILIFTAFLTVFIALHDEFGEEISGKDNVSLFFPLAVISLCLAGLSAAAHIVCFFITGCKAKNIANKILSVIKYISFCTAFVLISITLVCLLPGVGYARLISGFPLYAFALVPVLSIAEFILSDNMEIADSKLFYITLIPAVFYTAIRILIRTSINTERPRSAVFVFVSAIVTLLIMQICAGVVYNNIQIAKIRRKVRIRKHKIKNNPTQ